MFLIKFELTGRVIKQRNELNDLVQEPVGHSVCWLHASFSSFGCLRDCISIKPNVLVNKTCKMSIDTCKILIVPISQWIDCSSTVAKIDEFITSRMLHIQFSWTMTHSGIYVETQFSSTPTQNFNQKPMVIYGHRNNFN